MGVRQWINLEQVLATFKDSNCIDTMNDYSSKWSYISIDYNSKVDWIHSLLTLSQHSVGSGYSIYFAVFVSVRLSLLLLHFGVQSSVECPLGHTIL